MRSQTVVQHARRILCVFPRYTPSFGTFEHAYKLMGVKAFMPPQGILLIAAYVPEKWDVRFVDENIRAGHRREIDWADAVFVSGMHIQRQAMLDIARRAHARGKVCALGGPSVSASPEYYRRVRLSPYRRGRRRHRRADRHARRRCRPARRAAALRDRRPPAAAGLSDPGLST